MGLGFKLKRQKYMLCTKISNVECFENENYHVYSKLFRAIQHFFKMNTSARKLQESGNKQNKIKENEQNCQIIYTSNQ